MTRPPPPVAATCNLFCLRASGGSGSGSGSGGVGRGVGAAAPQVVRAIAVAEPHALGPRCPGPRRRPAPSPPLPPALPRPEHPALRRRLRRPRSSPGPLGGAGANRVPGGGGRGRPAPDSSGWDRGGGAGGRGAGPGCGLWRGQAWRRRDAAAAIATGPAQAPRSSPPSAPARPGVLQPGLPQPARRRGVGGRWRSASGSYGQRRRPLLSGGWWPGTGGAMGARPRPGPALPPTSLATGGAVGRWGEGGRGVAPPALGPGPPRSPLLGGALLPERPSCPGDAEPVPLPGPRPDCSAGKVTCAGAALAQPDAEGR